MTNEIDLNFIIGLTPTEANIKLKEINSLWYIRVTKKDSKPLIITHDFKYDRINVDIERDVIVQITGRG